MVAASSAPRGRCATLTGAETSFITISNEVTAISLIENDSIKEELHVAVENATDVSSVADNAEEAGAIIDSCAVGTDAG